MSNLSLVRLSDIVNELSVLRRDNDREGYLAALVASKSVLRDLRINYLNAFQRVYVQIDQSTNTARLPFDYYKFVTISVVQDCKDRFGKTTQKVLPLTHNPYINITPFKAPEGVCKTECNCVSSSPVCSELNNFETIVEVITLPNDTTANKTTILQTCANGDIIKQECQPVLQYIEGDQVCDYAVTMEILTDHLCSYTLDMRPIIAGLVAPYIVTFTLNGEEISSYFIVTSDDLDDFFAEYGWTKTAASQYSIQTQDDYETTVTAVDSATPEVENEGEMTKVCTEGNLLTFPYLISSYELNGTLVDVDETMEDQADQDLFFYDLGFDKVDNTHYTKELSEDAYGNIQIYIDEPSSPPTFLGTIEIEQSNCHNPLIENGYQEVCTTDVLCNVPVKEGCGCIIETPEAIATIVDCCSNYLNCCQVGMFSNWSNFGNCCPTNTPQPFNIKGTFNLDESNYLIYLDSVSATTLLLAYYNDGSCNGETYIPDAATELVKAGIAYRTAQNDMTIPEFRVERLRRDYTREKFEYSKWLNPIRINEFVAAVRTMITYG